MATSLAFDAGFYLNERPDVAQYALQNGLNASAFALEHFNAFGWLERSNPNSSFDVAYYLSTYTDVTAAGINPFDHFLTYGAAEDRNPNQAFGNQDVGANFDSATYLADNLDVAAAITAGLLTTAYQHFVLFGQFESRPAQLIDGTPIEQTFTLTDGIDTFFGGSENETFTAPVVQNFLGALTNTLESGDVLNGAGGVDVLRADLIATASTTIPIGPAISATTNEIEQVYFRAQTINTDVAVNWSNIDAEKMSGVEQWWTENSRSSVRIEDIRSEPEETTFGMRETDAVPGGLGGVAAIGAGAGLFAFFSPDKVTGGSTDTNSRLTLTLEDRLNPGTLADFPIDGIIFSLDGVQYALDTDIGVGADRTYPALVEAINTELAADPALVDLTAVLNTDNTITITDPNGGIFEPGGWSWINDVTPPDGDLVLRQVVGSPIPVEVVEETNVVLDFVGRTSQGGVLDIGSMADGGVNMFNVTVNRESWLSNMRSSSDLGDSLIGEFIFPAAPQNLETVNLASTGANGDLTVGYPVGNEETGILDGRAYDGVLDPRIRVYDGLDDVRTVDGSDFAGRLNLGMWLTDDSISRYLDAATGEVEFDYAASAQDDIFTFEVNGTLSQDPDFAMNVAMGAGDDRLNLANAARHGDGAELWARNIVVDGGTGDNTIAVNSSFGTTANNTFEGFSNFQTYEVEGGNDTEHDFTSMPGVTTVVIATDNVGGAGRNTTLIDLPVSLVAVSGKNQTLGNNSNANQLFGTIGVLGADAAILDVTLQNTARVDGVLSVDFLTIADESSANPSAVRTVNLESAGSRDTENLVNHIDGGRVNTFNLSGTQDLAANLVSAANYTAAAPDNLRVDADALTGDLDLQVNAAIVTAIDAAAGRTNTLIGTADDADPLTLEADLLTFYGAVQTTADTRVSAFETVAFGIEGFASSGSFDATNVTDVTLYDVAWLNGALEINHMDGSETVHINTDTFAGTQSNDLTLVAASQATTNALNIAYSDSTPAIPADTNFARFLFLQDFRTISIDLGGQATTDDAYTLNPVLLDKDGNVPTNLTMAETVYARVMAFTGGGDQGAAGAADGVDSLNVVTPFSTALTTVDFSEYVGDVTANFGSDATGAADLGTADVNNITVIGNGYGLTFAQNATSANITTFEFATDAVANTEDWQVTGFRGFGLGSDPVDINLNGATTSNLSVLDVAGLGVNGFADIVISTVTIAGVRSTQIVSNEGANFQIDLVGVHQSWLTNENFNFAA